MLPTKTLRVNWTSRIVASLYFSTAVNGPVYFRLQKLVCCLVPTHVVREKMDYLQLVSGKNITFYTEVTSRLSSPGFIPCMFASTLQNPTQVLRAALSIHNRSYVNKVVGCQCKRIWIIFVKHG